MLHRGILGLALAVALTVPAQAEYTFRPIGSGSGIGTVNGIVKGDGAGNPSQAIAGTDYLGPSLTNGRIYVGSVGNLATGVTMGGDCTIVAAGTITCTKTNGANFGTMATQNASGVAITGGSINANALSLTNNQAAQTVVAVNNNNAAGTAGFHTVGPSKISYFDQVGDTGAALATTTPSLQIAAANASGTIDLQTGTSPTTRVTVTSGGNVGIGTTDATGGQSYNVAAKVLGIVGDGSNANGSTGVLQLANNRPTPGVSDTAGQLDFASVNNGTQKRAAIINTTLTGSGGANGFGGDLAILTKPDNSTSITERLRVTSAGNVGIGTTSPAAQLHTTGTVRFAGIPSVGTPGCLANDASGNITGGNACSGGGMPAAGSRGQAPLNTAAGTANWFTEPFTNIAALSGADCSGAVATVISTVIGSIKSLALPTNCTLKVTGNDTIPAGTFIAIPCGARIQVDGSAVLTFNGETDDNACQKFAASGAGGGTGTGIVKGLRFNRPEWWGAFGDCNVGASCTHDDSGPLQQAFNSAQASAASSGGQRPQVKFGCNKGYGVSTGVVATVSLAIQMEISGCGSLNGGDGNSGSWLIGRSGFTGTILTVAPTGGGSVSTDIFVHDFGIYSINDFQADTCLQIGAAGQNMANLAGRSRVSGLHLQKCLHLLRLAGTIVSMQFERLWMKMGSNGGGGGVNASCLETNVTGTDALSEITYSGISCDNAPNSDASAICMNFKAAGTTFNITGTRIFDAACYSSTNGIVVQGSSSSIIADFWCYSCQMDAVRASGLGMSITTSGTATIANVVIDKHYVTSVAAMSAGINIDGSAGGTIKNIGVYGPYQSISSAGRGVRVETAQKVKVSGSRFEATYVNQGILLNNCRGCTANDNTMDGSAPFFVLLGGNTDYAQACNNTASGVLAPGSVSASVASGTHNVFFGSAYQSCPNN